MATKKNSSNTTAKRSAGVKRGNSPIVANFLNINGNLYSLGDLHTEQFSCIQDPSNSTKSLVEWAKQINAILRGDN